MKKNCKKSLSNHFFYYLCSRYHSCPRRIDATRVAFGRLFMLRWVTWKKVKWDRGIATYWNKKRRLLSALFLTNRNFATFKCSLEHSNGRCPRDVLFHIPLLVWLVASWRWVLYPYRERCIHIGVGFDVARSLHWAMRRPRFVGRVTGRFPRFFHV